MRHGNWGNEIYISCVIPNFTFLFISAPGGVLGEVVLGSILMPFGM